MTESKWRSDATTAPEDDFRHACCLMAGVLAELIFDCRNFRQASSLDEITMANALAANIAVKTGGNQADIMLRVICTTTDLLQSNADVVDNVATGLQRFGVLRKARLAPMLARVSKATWENSRWCGTLGEGHD